MHVTYCASGYVYHSDYDEIDKEAEQYKHCDLVACCHATIAFEELERILQYEFTFVHIIADAGKDDDTE